MSNIDWTLLGATTLASDGLVSYPDIRWWGYLTPPQRSILCSLQPQLPEHLKISSDAILPIARGIMGFVPFLRVFV